MEPRLFSRGNEMAVTQDEMKTVGFNGAAAFQPRKCLLKGRPRAAKTGFNGAAAFQPRKFSEPKTAGSGSSPASMEPRLFSRGNDKSVSSRRSSDMLQWSRGFSAAEMFDRFAASVWIIGGLQWSRGFSAAEINLHFVNRHIHNSCFNGAAAFQPRK